MINGSVRASEKETLSTATASVERVGSTTPEQPAISIEALKARDNVTNWSNLAHVWVIIGVTIAAAIWLDQELAAHGYHWVWRVVTAAAAIVIVGASQHQLGGVIHEGTHFLLFENKKLNELSSDWLAAFAIYTSTYQFRVHHLAHHQFVNDPERDPDIAQLHDSHHWLDFPVAHIDVLTKLAKQLWPPNLIRYTLVRARYSAVGHDDNPYIAKGEAGSKIPVRAGIAFAVGAPIVTHLLLQNTNPSAAWAFLIAAYAAVITYFVVLPERLFPQTRILPVISHRATAISRMTFLMTVYALFTYLDAGTGETRAFDMFGLYWVLPLFTSFPLFMMLRQWVQHGNADRGRYTNTRVFLANPFIRYAVFPWGMDYHLPHHMMASVPHYKLKDLHEYLQRDPKYREKAVTVEGFFGAEDNESGRPTAFSVLSERHAPKKPDAAHVDSATLEYADVKDPAAIKREAELSAGQSRQS